MSIVLVVVKLKKAAQLVVLWLEELGKVSKELAKGHMEDELIVGPD